MTVGAISDRTRGAIRNGRLGRWAVVIGIGAVVWILPLPAGLTRQSWHMLALFTATIAGVIVQPVPTSAIVLIGLTATMLTGTLRIEQALAGYANPIVWLPPTAFLMARAMINSGLGRRLAFLSIRAIGHSSLGLAYAFSATDVVLGTIIPSNGARIGGVLFPIATSITRSYGSLPGVTARRLGAFLLLSIYQCDTIVSAMFLTGQASNVLVSDLGRQATGIALTYGRWALAALLPGVVSLLILPYALFRLFPPEVTSTPDAARFATAELRAMGPMAASERLMAGVFLLVAALWSVGSWIGLNATVAAFMGLSLLLATGLLSWDDALNERPAWDVLIWFGGLVRMAEVLNEFGVTQRLATSASGWTAGWPWWAAGLVLLLVYFYAHYGFASITAHVSAMYAPFVAVAVGTGAPPFLAVAVLAFLSSLSASLTHYGTTPAPIYFGAGYVSQSDWWRLGFLVSLITIPIFLLVGGLWWKMLGYW